MAKASVRRHGMGHPEPPRDDERHSRPVPPMIHHLLRRLALGLVTLVLISFVVYGLIRSIPGTPLTVAAAQTDPSRRLNPADLET